MGPQLSYLIFDSISLAISWAANEHVTWSESVIAQLFQTLAWVFQNRKQLFEREKNFSSNWFSKIVDCDPENKTPRTQAAHFAYTKATDLFLMCLISSGGKLIIANGVAKSRESFWTCHIRLRMGKFKGKSDKSSDLSRGEKSEIYLLIKNIKSVVWRVAKYLSLYRGSAVPKS